MNTPLTKRIWMKLALLLVAVSMTGISLSTFLSIREMDYHFSMYLLETSKKHDQKITRMLAASYQQDQGWGKTSYRMLSDISTLLDLKIELFDATRHRLGSFGAGDHSNNKNGLTSAIQPISVDGRTVGFFSASKQSMTDTRPLEQHFQMAHTMAMQWTMLILTVLVCFASVLLARRFLKPVIELNKASLAAAGGNLSVRVSLPQGRDELTDLVHTFNSFISTLERQDELRKRLTSDIAHELRTPLNTILAQVEGMIDGIWEPTAEHLESTRREILRLTGLVSDLDEANQTEAGTFLMQTEVLDVYELAEHAVMVMRAPFQKKGVELVLVGESAVVKGDGKRLLQVMNNLLSNSLKYTAQGGYVNVRVQQGERDVVFTVTDMGKGIAAYDLPYVFERFYRGDRSRYWKDGGSGLGLTIAKSIVEAHAGSIAIESIQGAGTTVRVTLPRHV